MAIPRRYIADEVEKFDSGVTCDVTDQVKQKMFISI